MQVSDGTYHGGVALLAHPPSIHSWRMHHRAAFTYSPQTTRFKLTTDRRACRAGRTVAGRSPTMGRSHTNHAIWTNQPAATSTKEWHQTTGRVARAPLPLTPRSIMT